MGGPASITVQVPSARRDVATASLVQVQQTLEALEARYSRYLADSVVSQINARAGREEFTEVDEECRALLALADTLWRDSDGLFDPTVGVLNRVWDFQTGHLVNLPALEALQHQVGWDSVEITQEGVYLTVAGSEMDLGGLVKEYAADTVAQSLKEQGIESALVALAGDVVAVGSQADGRPWRVGISDPINPNESVFSLEMVDMAVCTSGSYARRFEYEGKLVSHLLNPHTGYPVDGPVSVSVIADTALIAGAVATVACLHDHHKAPLWLNRSGLPWLILDAQGHGVGPIHDKLNMPT